MSYSWLQLLVYVAALSLIVGNLGLRRGQGGWAIFLVPLSGLFLGVPSTAIFLILESEFMRPVIAWCAPYQVVVFAWAVGLVLKLYLDRRQALRRRISNWPGSFGKGLRLVVGAAFFGIWTSLIGWLWMLCGWLLN